MNELAGRLTEPMTFVFTDVVGSSRLWAADPQATGRSFLIHDAIVRSTLQEHHGNVFGWAGDSFRAAFADRRNAVAACDAVHRGLTDADWGQGPALVVRIGVTHGQALERDNEFFGPTVNTAARLESMARPGQTVLGASVVAGLDGVIIAALGRQRVRDVAEPMELFQLGSDPFPPLHTLDDSLSTVPPLVGDLIGRGAAVAASRHGLEQSRPVVIVGTGGAGKTRLAIEVAHLEMPNYPDGCYFVDLSPVASDVAAGPAIARGCRLKLRGDDDDDVLVEIAEHFADRQALLVLDNCEHMVHYAADFVRLLGIHAPAVNVLSTSRETLGVNGEQVINLGPLNAGHDGAAVELFVQRVRDRAPEFKPTTAELTQIAQICEHLDGIPLALELAAARAGVLGLSRLLDGMHDRFRVLASSRSDGTRTLREAIDWSFGLLSSDEQDFFVRCGIFSGSFDLRSAAAVAPDLDPLDVADLLQSLCRKSLIAAEGALGGRFRLLETIRAYAVLRVRDRGIEDELRELHFGYYRDLAAVSTLADSYDLDRVTWLQPEWPNIAEALGWVVDQQRWRDAAELVSGCIALWENVLSPVEGSRWIGRILEHVDDDSIEVDLLLIGAAIFDAQLDNFDGVRAALARVCQSSNPEMRANALVLTGYLTAREDPTQALAIFTQYDALQQSHEFGIDTEIAGLWARGAHSLYEPNLDEAHRCFREGFTLAQQAPQRTANTIYAGLSLVTIQLILRRPSEALATLDSYRWADSRWDSSPVLRAVALIDLGRADEAADLVFEYATEALLGRLPRMTNDALVGFAALALHRGEVDHAWTLMQQAITPRTPFTIGLVESLADRIDRGLELRTLHRGRTTSLAELDALAFLRAEIDRMDAAVAERVEV